MYRIIFGASWDDYFRKLDHSVQAIVLKRIEKMQDMPPRRHLKFGRVENVEEFGQYRIAYVTDEEEKVKVVYFVGTHKEYERWLGL